MKSIFLKKEVPLALFQQVGGVVSKENLLHNRLICSRAFIQLDDTCHYGLPLSPVKPGIYACMYHKYTAMDNLEESKGIRQVLDYITAHQYRIAGPYLAQVVAETSVFDYNDGKIIVK